ncbi:hypothetical protein IU498_09935 [Nocardia beijingensis]|uniref:type VII secretion target n=1 Tax=Nocardia beijingensis TaxID=95162 RepID=UPI0018937B70|nr:type VII secretion target [Nocardia beijingensis]MBF6074945.1 hypothetical protein [Nocardia beijingensis]
MPEYLDVEPDQLRQIAQQHDRRAAEIRKWGEIPHDWLAEFESGYGTIADPVRAALVDYYNRRHDAAERLATNHERTRDALNASAKALEEADLSGGSHIGNSGNFDNRAPSFGPVSGAPVDPTPMPGGGPNPPASYGDRPVPPTVTTPDAVPMPHETGGTDHAPLPPAATAPQLDDATLPAATAPTGTSPFSAGVPESEVGDVSRMPVVDIGSVAGPGDEADITAGWGEPNDAAGVAVAPDGDASTTGAMGAPAAAPFAAPVAAGMAGRNGRPLAAVPFAATGPFMAAAHVAKERQALPSFVVGEQVEDDLLLARTMLAAILAAVRDSAHGLEWAVAVGRAPVGPIVLLTSTEGRGWLPPGLFLPAEVAIPWRWDFILNSAARDSMAALEGITDPARILAEFGSRGTRRRNIRISALVSSAAIPGNVRAALGDDVAVEDWVNAAESAVDLTAPGAGQVDRLTLAGSDELLEQAAAVPDAQIRAKCLELARAAHAGVQAAVSGVDGEISGNRVVRQRILDAMSAGRPIPMSWWDGVRAAHERAAAELRSRRLDVSGVPVGARLDIAGTEALRAAVFERRADELLLLLGAGGADRQTLRDMLYSYGQIVEHPQFPAGARTVAAQAATTGVTGSVPDQQFARSAGSGTARATSISVSSIGLGGGAPPSIAEMVHGPAGSVSSGEQRRA